MSQGACPTMSILTVNISNYLNVVVVGYGGLATRHDLPLLSKDDSAIFILAMCYLLL